jgi:hypothetical protein
MAVDPTVACVEPGLDRDECKHDQDSNNEVEIGKISRDVTNSCEL